MLRDRIGPCPVAFVHLAAGWSFLAGACGESATPVIADVTEEIRESNLSIQVVPLTLEATTGVCYALEVWNGATDDFGFPTPERVWARDNVCSTQFGNNAGGGITYVGPCDADEPNNVVTLGIESVLGTGGVPLVEGQDWFNPCPLDNRCELYAYCEENRDTSVVFNITVMRSANQGFFDIAVRFDQVFCSGKIDCSDDVLGKTPLLMLHDQTGERGPTAVVAVSCTSGPWLTDNTDIFLNDVRVRCDAPAAPGGNISNVLQPSLTGFEGNQWDVTTVSPADSVWQYATYFGNEELFCSGLPCNKKYVNIAVGYNPEARGCRLEVEVTVAKKGKFPNFDSPAFSTWPVLVGRVQLTESDAPTGLPMCRKGALNAEGSGFHTIYTSMSDTGLPFCWRYADGVFEPRPDGACDEQGYYDFLGFQPLLCEGIGDAPLYASSDLDDAFMSGCRKAPINPQFACGGRVFIDASRACDGFADCPGGEDEIAFGCNTELFGCADGATYFSAAESCDGIPDCPDGDDEQGPGCTTALLDCGGGDVHVAAEQCDGVLDCRNGFDEGAAGAPFSCTPPTPFWTCLGDDQVVPYARLCDIWPDCDNGSDESICP